MTLLTMKFPENLVDFALDTLGNVFTITLAFHSKFQTAKVTHFFLDLMYIEKWTKFLSSARKSLCVLKDCMCDIRELFIV